MSRNLFRGGLAAAFVALGCVAARAALDGTDIPTKYAGFSVAVQTCQTGYGNASVSNVNGIVSGSELDAMYVSADSESLWIGITGNLPDVLASGESIIILLQTNPAGIPGLTNTLDTSNIVDFGGGNKSLRALNGMVLDTDFIPDKAVIVNKAYDGTQPTPIYMDAWDLTPPVPIAFQYNAAHVAQTPSVSCPNLADCITNNACIMSGYINTTNLAGVDADETKDGAVQAGLAATAVKGLRVRLSRICFQINDPIIKVMAVIASPDGTISNQFLPPLTNGEDPVAPNCYPTYDPGTMTGGPPNLDTMTGNQYATVNLAAPGFDTAPNLTAGGGLGSGTDNIPAQWGAGALVATQTIHTCYGDAQNGTVQLATPGSELDQLFIRNADLPATDNYLHLAITGNLEPGGNKVYIFIDSKAGGENPLIDDNGGDAMTRWNGRGFDAGFTPDFCYVFNISGGTSYYDVYDIQEPVQASAKRYLGSSQVNSVDGVLTGGTNTNNDLFVVNNTNVLGVNGSTPPPGDPLTATTGLEARISLAELGVDLSTGNHCQDIKVMAILGNGSGEYLSNQCLPGFVTGTPNINNEVTTPTPEPKFNFGDDTQRAGAFVGAQFATYTARRLGDLNGDCCLNGADIAQFARVTAGLETDPVLKFRANMNQDVTGGGLQINDAADVPLFVNRLLAPGACP